jgi:hypothetical protein
MILALLLTLLPMQATLDTWVNQSDRLFLGKIERVFDVTFGELKNHRLAEVQIDRHFIGHRNEETLYVLEKSLKPGDRGLFFLKTWKSQNDDNLLVFRGNGIRVIIRAWQPVAPKSERSIYGGIHLPVGLLENVTSTDPIRIEELVDSTLEASLTRCLPRIEASLTMLGPGWNIKIGPNRKIEGTRKEQALSVEDWKKLLRLIEICRFSELPAMVGQGIGLCAPIIIIEFKTRTSHNIVELLDSDEVQPGPASEWTRAQTVWNALCEFH